MRIIGIPTWKCEPYSLSKIKEIISRDPTENPVTTPFKRIQFDRFIHKKALNGYKYADLYRCEATEIILYRFFTQKS